MTKIPTSFRQLTLVVLTTLVGATGALAAPPNASAEAQRGTLRNEPGQYQANALRRCEVHQGTERAACEARILGQGDITRGAQAGGILRQSITVTPPPAN